MPKKLSTRLLSRPQLSKLLPQLKSPRKPSRVITPGGITHRGSPSSWKCQSPCFQSLVEEDCQRVAEIASSVTSYETHSLTFELGTSERSFRYTPDLILWFGDSGAVCEVKPRSKLSSRKTATRLKEVIDRLDHHGIPLVLMLDTDVRAHNLQRMLLLLQRDRPVRGPFQSDIDASQWDPLGRSAGSAEVLARWKCAQRICDELLHRVMRRDPGELFSAA